MCLPSLLFPETDSLDGVAVHDEDSTQNTLCVNGKKRKSNGFSSLYGLQTANGYLERTVG